MYDSGPLREDADKNPGLFQQRWRQPNIPIILQTPALPIPPDFRKNPRPSLSLLSVTMC